MNAEEIRSKQFATFQSHEAYFLRELCAQVAEVVEQLRILNEPVEQAKPKWVELLTVNHHPFSISIDNVGSLSRASDPTDPDRLICSLETKTGYHVRVVGDYKILCAKLGIPVEG